MKFEDLPEAVCKIQDKLSLIERLLSDRTNEVRSDSDKWLSLEELCIYHPDKPRKATVYGWVHSGSIPVHKGGKKLRFFKSEIDEWLLQGRKKTISEYSKDADTYLTSKKKGGKI